jgi:DNA-binding protein HU-beta
MTKADVITVLANRTGMARKEAAEAVNLFLDTVRQALEEGEKVSLVGFGTFYVKEKNARQGRNPRTGERIKIPPKRVATFKPGRSFRQQVNPGPEPPSENPTTGAEPTVPEPPTF